jgi:uncharacterized membrane protein
MDLIDYYYLFALTTGITSCYEFLLPAIAKAKAEDISNSFTKRPILSCLVYTITTTIFAPFTIFPIIVMSTNAKFRLGVERVVMEQDE